MGQYYQVLIKNRDEKIKVYNRNIIVNGKEEYMLAKLMEHSWWLNPFVNAVAETLYQEPHNILWLGDYSKDFMKKYPNGFNGHSVTQVDKWAKIVWNKETKTYPIEQTDFTLDKKYLVNHTKKEYVNCSSYFESSCTRTNDNGDWCIHPLPLLTCIGNGMGGGDYTCPTLSSTEELVGAWSYDNISVEDAPPEQYEEIYPLFKERGLEDEE